MSQLHFLTLLATARMLLVVFLAAVTFWLADRRWHLVAKFMAEKRTPLDLAIIRIVLMAWLMQLSLSRVLVFASLDPALVYPPTGWGRLAMLFPRNRHLILGAYVVFLVSAALALIGLWTRVSVPLAAAGAFYLMTIPQLFGKINHGHHLILFAILLAFSPCGDALSVDALHRCDRRRAFHDGQLGECVRQQRRIAGQVDLEDDACVRRLLLDDFHADDVALEASDDAGQFVKDAMPHGADDFDPASHARAFLRRERPFDRAFGTRRLPGRRERRWTRCRIPQ